MGADQIGRGAICIRDRPTATVIGIKPRHLPGKTIEEVQPTAGGQELCRIMRGHISQVDLGEEGVGCLISPWPDKGGREIRTTSDLRGTDRDVSIVDELA
jgi:hypothetical protein